MSDLSFIGVDLHQWTYIFKEGQGRDVLWFPAEHGFDFDTWRDQVWDFVEELLPVIPRPKDSTYYATELAGRFPLRFSFLADDEERWEGLWPERIELGGFQVFQLPGQTFQNELNEETGDVVTEMVKLVNRIRTLMLVVEEAANQPGVRPSANGNGRYH